MTPAGQRNHVTYIIGSLGVGGAERQLIELLRGIDRSRWEPSLVLFDDLDLESGQQLVSEVFSLGMNRNGPSKARFRGWKTAKAIARLGGILRKLRPQVVHAILPASFVLAAPAVKIARVPVLVGSRRCLVDSYRTDALISAVDAIATRMCDFVLGNSTAVTEQVVSLDRVPRSRTATIHNGVDLQRFRPGDKKDRQKFGFSESDLVFGNVANFIPYKRHIDFVDAAAIVASQLPNARFLLAGEDRGILPEIRQRIQQAGLENRFAIVPGARDPESLYPLMDVYICSSATEGLSNVLLEAAATALPIIATDVGGNREVVQDGVNGMIVPSRQPEKIAAAAVRLAKDATLRKTMGDRSRRRMEEDFSLQSMVKKHESIYRELLESRMNGQAV